jgi:hypothetical protein
MLMLMLFLFSFYERKPRIVLRLIFYAIYEAEISLCDFNTNNF